jgi:hypothetical protein
MNQQTRGIQTVLEKRVSEILFYVWDPIGVNRMPACRGEYEDYVPIITAYLLDNFPESGVDALMMFILDGYSGVRLTKPPRRKSQHLEALRLLVEWRSDLFAKVPDSRVYASVFPKHDSYGDQLEWSRKTSSSHQTSQSNVINE